MTNSKSIHVQLKKKSSEEKHLAEGFMGQRKIVVPPNVERRIRNNAIIKNFYLTAIGFYPNANYHDIERLSGDRQFILLYCVAGEGRVFIQDQQVEILPNTYFIIPKLTKHRYQSSQEKPWTIYWVHFDGVIASEIYKRTLVDGEFMAHPLAYDENRIKLFEDLFQILENSYAEKDMEIINISLFYFISSIVYHKETNPEVFDNDIVSHSILYMKHKINQKLNVSDLASERGISASHYIRIFKIKMGLSPINYFNQLKVQNSCQFLYFTDKSIKEICVELGFDDPYYFSRLFRKLMGMSPSKYKKLHKK